MNEIQKKIIRQSFPLVFGAVASIISIVMFVTQFKSIQSIEIIIGVIGAIVGVAIAYVLVKLRDATNPQKIFISYANEDSEFVHKLYNALQDLHVIVWWDKKEIHVGDDIKKRIDEFLNNCDYLLFVISKNSSESEWASTEIKKALSMKKKILPVLLDDSEPPQIIKNIHFADFSKEFGEGMDSIEKAFSTSRYNQPLKTDRRNGLS